MAGKKNGLTRQDMVAEDRRQQEIMMKRTAEKKAVEKSGKIPPLTANQKRPLIGKRTPTTKTGKK